MPRLSHARRAAAAVLLAAFACAFVPAQAADTAAPPSAADARAGSDALLRAHAAVVGIEVIATEEASSIQTLGRRRSGSGVVIGADGLVLTIGYLTLEADRIAIRTRDGRQVPARAVGYDLATGFGLVQPLLPLAGVPAVPLGSVADAQPGEPLLAVVGGEAGGTGVTRLVSKRAFSGYWEYHIEPALFTSPPIGNHSGAPVFNGRGELLGIGSLFVGDAAGLGQRMPGNMFVPVDLLKPILAELRDSGTTRASRRPWLGLSSAENSGRVLVVRVAPDSPAQAAGLGPGDVVLAIEGTPVDSLERLYKRLWAQPDPQAEIALTVRQGGEVRVLKVQPVDRLQTLRRPPGI